MIWVQAGFAMTLLSASIKAIPEDIVEAARLDGVGGLRMFRYITIPSIRPSLIVVLTTISITTLKAFDIVRTATGGNFDTSVLAYEFYVQSFRSNNAGLGAALATMIFVLVLPIVIYNVRQLRKLEARCSLADPDVSVESMVAKETASSAAKKKLSSPWASLAAVVIAVMWTIPTAGLLITSFRSEDDIKSSGWWTGLTGPIHHGQLPTVMEGGDIEPHDVPHQLVHHHDPSGADPDQHRDDGGVRVRVDAVPAAELPVRGDLRAPDRADPGDDDPAALDLRAPHLRPDRHRGAGRGSTRSGSRTRSSRCRWRST